jgi:hypothetical protein
VKLQLLCGVLWLCGCATVSSPRPEVRESLAAGVGGSGEVQPDPVRLESTAGTFLVHPNNAQDFVKLLAGEPTQHQYFSGGDVP